MSTTIYIDPQGTRHPNRPPRSITLPPLPGKPAGQTVSLPADCSPAAWRAQPGCTTIEEPDPEPATQADIDQADALALATTHPELPATLRDCFEALHDATQLGVDLDLSLGLPGWDLLGAAFADAILAAEDPRPLMALELRARGAWLHYQHHAGSPETAYRLAQEIAQLP
jgi:hypothetical protein